MIIKTVPKLLQRTAGTFFTLAFLLTVAVCSGKPAVDSVNPMIGTDAHGTFIPEPQTQLQSTNVALPLSQWQINTTGSFDGSGNVSTNIANIATNLQEFYILKVQ
jgi:hypothetical protein